MPCLASQNDDKGFFGLGITPLAAFARALLCFLCVQYKAVARLHCTLHFFSLSLSIHAIFFERLVVAAPPWRRCCKPPLSGRGAIIMVAPVCGAVRCVYELLESSFNSTGSLKYTEPTRDELLPILRWSFHYAQIYSFSRRTGCANFFIPSSPFSIFIFFQLVSFTKLLHRRLY